MTTERILPPRLPAAGTLGIIATSSPISEGGDDLMERGYRRLRERGFEIVEAPNCRETHGHTAGTVRARVDALHEFFDDPEIDAIVSFWGGLNTNHLLEHLDWELIADNPKPLVGYSDLTCLTNAITERTGLVTFAGPGVITFAKPTMFDYSWRWFDKVLIEGGSELTYEPSPVCSDNAWYERDDNAMLERDAPGWTCYQPGRATGRIVGGNIDTFLRLAGTPNWPEMAGKILFVEEDEAETPGTVDRMFTHLRQMGVFDQIAGLVVGRFPETVGFDEDDSLEMILDEALDGYDLPVMTHVDFGHTDPRMTFPIGIECRMESESQSLELLEPWLRENEFE